MRAGDLLLHLQVVPRQVVATSSPSKRDTAISTHIVRSALIILTAEWGDVCNIILRFVPSIQRTIQAPVLEAVPCAELVDPRLVSIRPSFWTSVTNHDDHVRHLLRHYPYEYHFIS